MRQPLPFRVHPLAGGERVKRCSPPVKLPLTVERRQKSVLTPMKPASSGNTGRMSVELRRSLRSPEHPAFCLTRKSHFVDARLIHSVDKLIFLAIFRG